MESSAAQPVVAAPPVAADADTLLRILDGNTILHARPMEFFLGNSTNRDQIDLNVTFDANVYTRADAEEFIDECRSAALFYLGAGESRSKL